MWKLTRSSGAVDDAPVASLISDTLAARVGLSRKNCWKSLFPLFMTVVSAHESHSPARVQRGMRVRSPQMIPIVISVW